MQVAGYPSNLFSSTSSTQSSLNNYGRFFAGANYYKLMSQYAIKQKYSQSTAQTTHTSPVKPNTNTSSSKEATKFLSDYSTTYDSLTSATKNLKSKLDDSTVSNESKVSAVKDYVKAYNDTLTFLQDHAGDSTYAINRLKNSLESITSISKSTSAGLGLSIDDDNMLSLDTTKLLKALNTNASSTTKNLTSLANLTEAHNSLAKNTSNAKLLQEQNMLRVNSASMNSVGYNNLLAFGNNSFALRNYYYGLACSGTLMDISI